MKNVIFYKISKKDLNDLIKKSFNIKKNMAHIGYFFIHIATQNRNINNARKKDDCSPNFIDEKVQELTDNLPKNYVKVTDILTNDEKKEIEKHYEEIKEHSSY